MFTRFLSHTELSFDFLHYTVICVSLIILAKTKTNLKDPDPKGAVFHTFLVFPEQEIFFFPMGDVVL